MKVHIVIDVVTGAFLALSPWLLGFMDSENPVQWVPHLVVGLMIMGYALLTTTADDNTKSIASN